MTVGTNVLVVADAGWGLLTGPARELLALGRSLADAFGGSVDFLVLGAPASKLAADVTAAGADRICVAEEADRPGYHPEPFAALVLAACRELAPRIVLLTYGPLGLDLAPRVAFGIGARWVANCVGVRCRSGGPAVPARRSRWQDPHRRSDRRIRRADPAPDERRRACAAAGPPGQFHVDFGAGNPRGCRRLRRAAPGGRRGCGGTRAGGDGRDRRSGHGLAGGVRQTRGTRARSRGVAGRLQASGRQGLDLCRPAGRPDRRDRRSQVILDVGGLRRVAAHGRLPEVEADRRCQSRSCAPIFQFARYGVVAKWEEVVPELLARLPMAAH